MTPAAAQAALVAAQYLKERRKANIAARKAALERLQATPGYRRPILGQLTAQDLADIGTLARSPVVAVPVTLAVLGMIGSSPRATKLIEEGVACISRGVGQGVAAGLSGAARGLWDGFVWDPSERDGVIESIIKFVPRKTGELNPWD